MPDDNTDVPIESTRNPVMEETRTSIDALLELLRQKGKLELNNIAVTLNIDPRIVEGWAKVLEKGNLVRITYEVGRMYLEPIRLGVEEQADLRSRTDAIKFVLQEDLAVERISIDKFAKNIETLNTTIAGIEKVYQQKMPDIHRILTEVDKSYDPIAAKRRSIVKIKEDSEKTYILVNKKIDDLYAKLNSFSPKQAEIDTSAKFSKLNSILERIAKAQAAMVEAEKNNDKFFEGLEITVEEKTRELRTQIRASHQNTTEQLKAGNRELAALIKGVNEDAAQARDITKEVENFRKEFEKAKHSINLLKSEFNDRYQRIMEGIEKDSKLIDSKSEVVENSVRSIKESMGEISKLDDQIRLWKKNMNEMSKEITITRMEVLKLTSQLNVLDSNKNLSVEKKAEFTKALNEEGKKTKSRVSKIRKIIKDTADQIKEHTEEPG